MTTEIRIIIKMTDRQPSSHRGRLLFQLKSRRAVTSIVHTPPVVAQRLDKNVSIVRLVSNTLNKNALIYQRLASSGGHGRSSTLKTVSEPSVKKYKCL